jgi:hypothetical protein
MSHLAETLRDHHNEITEHLYIGYANWDELINRIERQERKPLDDFADEQIWTFLVGCGYAVSGQEGVAKLAETLAGSKYGIPPISKIWFEVLPIPPRKGEGGTHLDLALGTIAQRKGTESGIELGNVESSWICFCEMKWYSDISYNVTFDQHRNQLARVIENALCFQSNTGKFAEKIHAILVTPKVFQSASVKSRLYQYKYYEYCSDSSTIKRDLDICRLVKNENYPPDIQGRISLLSLRWLSYEELFDNIPMSSISDELKRFAVENDKSSR